MIEYFLITAFYSLGAWFSALEKINAIRKRNPRATFKEVKNTYVQEEWNTMMSVAACWALIILAWFIIHRNNVKVPSWIHDWGVYPISLVCGYCLHRLIFKFLGTTEKAVEKKVEDKINSI